MGQTGFCEIPRFSANICGFLPKSAPPKCCNSQEEAKISQHQRKSADLAPFVPFSLSLSIPLDFLFSVDFIGWIFLLRGIPEPQICRKLVWLQNSLNAVKGRYVRNLRLKDPAAILLASH